VLTKLYTAYQEGDADLTEINPLVLTEDGQVIALDAKVSLDAAAAVRNPEWEEFEKPPILDDRERQAAEFGLQYVGLDGQVGILANGAGLAMATLDIVQQVGGSPANFLDIGGGAKADLVANALTVLYGDDNVKAVFINIFGGITRGEEVAAGIVEGMSRVDLKAPVVVRLDGTNAEEGRAILDEAINDNRFNGMLYREDTMLTAAHKAVEIVGGAS
jgi:succinyl-CoA synthetase beta subunit